LKSQSFFADTLKRKHLGATEYKKLETRGRDALHRYLTERSDTFKQQDLFERGFNNEGVVVGDARLSGKIDKIHFPSSGTALVVDFKTGKPAKTWSGKDAYERIKLHKYRQQLLFYKLLVEGSGSFKGKITVQGGELEFIEPDVTGKLVPNLPLTFSPKELLDFMRLVEVVWQHICQLSFPDVSHYPATLKGIQAFEKDLIDKKI
jgi:DNA helicase-2/ATP-dependent DNA helicase PcrA